jgi:hypothetical protein
MGVANTRTEIGGFVSTLLRWHVLARSPLSRSMNYAGPFAYPWEGRLSSVLALVAGSPVVRTRMALFNSWDRNPMWSSFMCNPTFGATPSSSVDMFYGAIRLFDSRTQDSARCAL